MVVVTGEDLRKVVHEALRQHQLWGLAQARISLLTSEQPALVEVELHECHALEHLDVAWGSGGRGKA